MIFSAKRTKIRREYRQISQRRWAWVKVADVSIPDLELTATIALPDDVTASTVTTFLKSSEELLELATQASEKLSGTAFQLTVTEDGKR